MPKSKFEIHVSDVSTFKKCRILWNYSSPLRRNLEVAFPPVFFFLGSGVHSALQTYYERGVNPATAFKLWYWWRTQIFEGGGHTLTDEQRAKYAEQAKLGVGLLKHYAQRYPLEKEPFELVLAERYFEVPIRTLSGRRSRNYFAAGTFDGVIVDRKGRYWLLEHKTYAQVRGEAQFELSDQTKMYVYAANEQYGLPVQGVLYNILRKKIPTIPRELNRGGLTRAKGIDTTYSIYLKEIKRLGLIPSDYADILGQLQERGNTFFQRFQIRKTTQEMKVFQKLLYITTREMCKPSLVLYPSNDDWVCRNCWFREPCIMAQLGERAAAEGWLDLNARPRRYRADRKEFDYEVVRKTYQAVKNQKTQTESEEQPTKPRFTLTIKATNEGDK